MHDTRLAARTAPGRIEPFWARLPRIALYPFQGAALYTLIVLTALKLLGLVPVVGFVVTAPARGRIGLFGEHHLARRRRRTAAPRTR